MRKSTLATGVLGLLVGLGLGVLVHHTIRSGRQDVATQTATRKSELPQVNRELEELKGELRASRHKVAEFQALLEQHAASGQLQPDGRPSVVSAEERERRREAEEVKQAEYRRLRAERRRQEEERLKVEAERRRQAAEDPGKLVVEGRWRYGFACYDGVTLQRLLAWRKGDLNEYTRAYAHLEVREVISGTAPELSGGYDCSPWMGVYFLNDVAIAMKHCKEASGTWTLTALPDGTYAVTEIQDTPFPLNRAELRKPFLDCAEDLTSGDSRRQLSGLRFMQGTRCFNLVPHAIRLLDSRETVDGESIAKTAYDALVRVTHGLFRYGKPIPTGKAAWEEWWADVLATDPFPIVRMASGELRSLAKIRSDQFAPQLYVDPKCRFAVVAVARLKTPEHGARSGIRLLGLNEEKTVDDDFIYKVPLEEPNREPGNLAAASSETHVALAWSEYGYSKEEGTVRFMTVKLSTRQSVVVDLRCKGVKYLALCPLPLDRWLLAYSYVPPGEDFLNPVNLKYDLLILDHQGQRLEEPFFFRVPGIPNQQNDGLLATMTKLPDGLAAGMRTPDGFHLLLIDESLALRKRVTIGAQRDTGCFVFFGVAANDDALCVAWRANSRVFARTIRTTGDELSETQVLSPEATGYFSGPVCIKDGFAIIWADRSQTPHQVRLVRISREGTLGSPHVIFNGLTPLGELALGAEAGIAQAAFYEHGGHPSNVWLKSVDLGDIQDQVAPPGNFNPQ